jgi:hypothetical protein
VDSNALAEEYLPIVLLGAVLRLLGEEERPASSGRFMTARLRCPFHARYKLGSDANAVQRLRSTERKAQKAGLTW